MVSLKCPIHAKMGTLTLPLCNSVFLNLFVEEGEKAYKKYSVLYYTLL